MASKKVLVVQNEYNDFQVTVSNQTVTLNEIESTGEYTLVALSLTYEELLDIVEFVKNQID